MKLDFSFETQQGPRPYQEDRWFLAYVLDGYLAAVMDGHGGDKTSEYVKRRLEEVWVSFEQLPPIERIKETFKALHLFTQQERSGTTLSLAWFPDNEERVYTAVLGDSLILVKSYSGEVYTSVEHNVRSNPKSEAEVREKGGFVRGGYAMMHFSGDGLQMSRALGDANLAPILTREPDLADYPLGKGSFVLLGTDGCFDPGHGDEDAVGKVVKMVEEGATAKEVVSHAIDKGVYDNATAILVRVG